MTVLALEQMPLPSRLAIKISRTRAIFRLFVSLVMLPLFALAWLSSVDALIKADSSLFLCGVFFVAGTGGVWICVLIVFQSLKNLGNAGTPTLTLSEENLEICSFKISWPYVNALSHHFFAGDAMFQYASIEICAAADALPQSDMTETAIPAIFKAHKKKTRITPQRFTHTA